MLEIFERLQIVVAVLAVYASAWFWIRSKMIIESGWERNLAATLLACGATIFAGGALLIACGVGEWVLVGFGK